MCRVGAGLSSSASLEVATAMALLSHAGTELPLKTVATLCRRTENEFVGAKSGIMDQFVVAGGVADGRCCWIAVRWSLSCCRCRTRCGSWFAIRWCKHEDATGEYGDRSDEVEAGQAVLRRERPGIELLRDATLADLEACRDKMSAASFARCRHIITENARVLEAREALLRGDVKRFGELMVEAHASMRDDFAASCAGGRCAGGDRDAAAGLFWRSDYRRRIWRMHGESGRARIRLRHLCEAVRREYKAALGIEADCFVCAPSDGALAMAAKGGVQ